jgi:hypothetical protein
MLDKKMNMNKFKKSITFPRIYYPGTSRKEITEMSHKEFDDYLKACKMDMVKVINLARKNYIMQKFSSKDEET